MHTSKRGKLNKKENSMKQYLMKKNSIDIIQRRKTLVTTNSRAKPQKENFKGKTHHLVFLFILWGLFPMASRVVIITNGKKYPKYMWLVESIEVGVLSLKIWKVMGWFEREKSLLECSQQLKQTTYATFLSLLIHCLCNLDWL